MRKVVQQFTRVLPLTSALALFFLSAGLQTRPFTSLIQLKGTWKILTAKQPLFEAWSIKSDSSMDGKSFRVVGQDTFLLEQVQLMQRGGDVFYVPTVRDQNDGKPVSFKLVRSTNNRYVFENLQHDYPQRIIYHLVHPDSVVARIEGSKNGITTGSDFPMKRMR